MPKDRLTDTALKAARPRQKPYKLFDGGGLYLLIRPDGSRYWRLKYRVDGTEKVLALGVYPETSLAKARRKRDAARNLLHNENTDPGEARRKDRAARRAAAESTFEAVAREWFSKRSRNWARSNSKVILRRLERDVFRYVGSRPIAGLDSATLLGVLKRVEERGAIESAHRVRQYIAAVMRYAMHNRLIASDPTPHPEALTPTSPERFASITDPDGVGQLMRAIRGYRGTQVGRLALALAPLVFARPGELRGAEWSEFDLDAAEWRIPATRTKMRRDHLVPLSTQAVTILRELEKLTGRGRFVFPSERSRARPISANTLLAALRTLGYSKEQMTPHGFRHMASTLLHESRKFRSEVIERQLAHADRNAIRAVYNAAEYFAERKELMQWWADRLDALASASNVVSIKARA